MSMEWLDVMLSAGKNSWSIRALWQSYQDSHPVVKQEELGKEIMNIALTKPSSTDGFDPANFDSNG